MKIRSNDYNELDKKIGDFLKRYPSVDINKGLTSERYRWDIYHAAKAFNSRHYDYLNDDNIDTALKSILKKRKGTWAKRRK